MMNPEEMFKLSPDLQEGLATLFLWWYGNLPSIRRVLRDSEDASMTTYAEEMNPRDIEEAWRSRWFAKGDLQIPVDSFVTESFAWMLDEPGVLDFHPTRLWEKLAMIVLFDQITRNSRRGTPQAYEYDQIALPIALDLTTQKLPFHFKATIAICLCHSETVEVQQTLASYVVSTSGHPLGAALLNIARKHQERVVEFGRFPERNRILGRQSTPREEAYLSQLR